MAERLDPATAGEATQAMGPTAGHNAAVRREALQKAALDIRTLTTQRAEVQARASGLAKQITTIYRRLKADFGWQRSELEYALRTAALPEGERSELMSTLHEAFDALGLGEQATFLSAGGFTEDRQPDTSKAGLKRAYQAGYLAAEHDGDVSDCPHPNSGKRHRMLRDEWLKGFQAVQKKRALAKGPKKPKAKRAKKGAAGEVEQPEAAEPAEAAE